jgi:hypothetical protein
MAINSILSQSNYPIQTIINNDTVVILTKQQADDINVIFESQKVKIKSLREERDSLLSLSSELKKETIIVDNRGNEKSFSKNKYYFICTSII